MLYAKNNDSLRIRAIPNTQASCPHCGEVVISKCGGSQLYESSEEARKNNHNIWHWAHKIKCIYETEPMTEWHINWQELAEKNGCEIEVNLGSRIADAMNSNTDIIEFQHSPISIEDLIARCEFYKELDLKIHWVFDVSHVSDNFNFYRRQIADKTYWVESKNTRSKSKKTFYQKPIYHYDFTRMYFDWKRYPQKISELLKLKYGDVYLDVGGYIQGDGTYKDNIRPMFFESIKQRQLFKLISLNSGVFVDLTTCFKRF